ncbi:Bug family tripartite tricarboxylate transporter substrate binding protein [Massilia niastensis]|uniref:Bug family tripartite tricarboxylate transporter substrate binding protein n=1 Tax=Massilia niastensis TaxID=544911 RepID=UPI0004763B66|nr:tripartite tricarboxylate transporter substrate binding protein [Massilia niastensis]
MTFKTSGIPRRSLLTFALCASLVPAMALADTYPSKPVKVIVGFSAGGAVDNVARLVTQSMGKSMGGSFYVENRPGATGVIAAEQAAKAPADGYNVLVATQSTMVVAPSIYAKMKVDPVADFTPISLLASVPMVMVVNPAVPVKNIQELIAYARRQNGGMSYASSGQGGPQHVATELFSQMAKVPMVHVPYKGEANAISDLLGNQVPVMFGNLPSLLPHIKSGKLRALAVSSLQRSNAAPEIPTVAESGLPGFEALTWFGMFVPAGTPQPIVDRLNAEVKKSLGSPDVRAKLGQQGLTAVGGSSAELKAYMQQEVPKWAKLLRSANIKAE